MSKTNIYGDYKVCIKCKDPADVIEGTKDYCIECWYDHVNNGKSFKQVIEGTKDYCIECWYDHVNNGKSFKQVDKQIKEEERFIKKK
jgi:hypothetical protein